MASLLAACAVPVPWRNEPIGNEVNLAFTVQNNLLLLGGVRIDDRAGRYIFGSATPRSAVDTRLGAGPHTLSLSEKASRPLTPVVLDLQGVADAILGADLAAGQAVTVDYHSGLVTLQKEGIHPELMTLFRYAAEPAVTAAVDGRDVTAVVDTALPDTMVLPRASPGRGSVRLRLAGVDLGVVDVQYAQVAQARLGNRVLSKFLVSIDYGRRVVGLWRDPRNP